MIEFKIPSDDEVALHHIGIALTNIAREMGYVANELGIEEPLVTSDTTKKVEVELVHNDEVINSTVVDAPPAPPVEEDTKTVEEQYSALAEDGAQPIEISGDVELDANGLPWDRRIHSTKRSKNADGTWRNARKPKAFEGDWTAHITDVEAELKMALGIVEDVEQPEIDDVPPPPPVTEESVAEEVELPFGQPSNDDVPPPPPVVDELAAEEPTNDVPPPPAADRELKKFADVMGLVTGNLANEEGIKKVNEVLQNNYNIPSLQTMGSVVGMDANETATNIYYDIEALI